MTIKTDYSKAFSYARMQNGIPAIRSITIHNKGKEPLPNVRLSIGFDPAFAAKYEAVLSEVPKGKTILDNVRLLPSASFLANLTERMEGTMTVTVESEELGAQGEKYPVSLLPYDFWEGITDAPELLIPKTPLHGCLTFALAVRVSGIFRGRGTPSASARGGSGRLYQES